MRHRKSIIWLTILSCLSALGVSCVHISPRPALTWTVVDIQPHQIRYVVDSYDYDCWRVDIEVSNATTNEVYVDWKRDKNAFLADGRWESLKISALLPYLGPSDSRTLSLYVPRQAQACRSLMYYTDDSTSRHYKQLVIEVKIPQKDIASVPPKTATPARTSPLQPDLGVTFLGVTNGVATNRVEGIFQITNRLNTYVYIYTTSIQLADGASWMFLSKTGWHPLGMIDPHEQFLFQTWVPERGGVYRLELYGSRAEYFSDPFRVSPGPPVRPEDFPVISLPSH